MEQINVTEQKMKNVYEPLVEELKLYFPHIYDKMVRWYPSGPMQIIIVANNDKRYEYNAMTGYVHRMPEPGDDIYYKNKDMFKQEFKYKLRKVMSNRSINQQELSALSGITEKTISLYMNGERVPDAFFLARITKALECEVSELFDFYMEDEEE